MWLRLSSFCSRMFCGVREVCLHRFAVQVCDGRFRVDILGKGSNCKLRNAMRPFSDNVSESKQASVS